VTADSAGESSVTAASTVLPLNVAEIVAATSVGKDPNWAVNVAVVAP
jgi:hypothetical protein